MGAVKDKVGVAKKVFLEMLELGLIGYVFTFS